MPDNQSLGSRLRKDLTTNLSVSLSAIVLAALAFFALIQVSDSITGGFLLAINIAVFIPYAYEQYWPDEYGAGAAFVWTVCASLVTSGLYIGLYQLSFEVISGGYNAGVAFVVTVILQYAVAALFARVR